MARVGLRRGARRPRRRRRRGGADRGRLPQPARRRWSSPPTPSSATAASWSRHLPDIDVTAIDGRDEPATPAEARAITEGYEALRRLLAAFGERFERAQGGALGGRLRRPPAAGARAAPRQRGRSPTPSGRASTTCSSTSSRTRARSRSSSSRMLAGTGDAHVHGRRRRPVDLRLPRRRPRELPPRAGRRLAAAAAARRCSGLTGSFRSTPDVLAAVNLIGAELLGDFTPLARRPRAAAAPGPGRARRSRSCSPTRRDGARRRTGPRSRPSPPTRRRTGSPRPARSPRACASSPTTGVEPGLDGAAAAGVHARRRLRRGARAGRARPLRRRRPRLLVLPAGDRRAQPARLRRQPARRRVAARRPRLAGGRGLPRRPLDAAADRRPAAPLAGRRASSPGPPTRTPTPRERTTPRRLRGSPSSGAGAEPSEPRDRERIAGFHDTLVGLRVEAALLPLDELVERTLEDVRLRPRGAADGRRAAPDRQPAQARPPRRRVRGPRGPGPAGVPRPGRRPGGADRPRGGGRGRRRGPRRRPGDDRPRGQGARVRLRGGRRSRAQARRAAVTRRRCASPTTTDGEAPPRIGLRLARAGAATIDLAGYRELNDHAADAEAEESGRLAYVAASRARSRLLLSGTIDPEKDARGHRPAAAAALGARQPPARARRRAATTGRSSRARRRRRLPGVDARPLRAGADPVRVTGAGAGIGGRLAVDAAGAAARRRPARGGTPPMLALAERGTAAARSLSYAALADYERCGYRFLAERILRLGAATEIRLARRRRGRRPAVGHGLRPGRPRAARVVGAELVAAAARGPWSPPRSGARASATRGRAAPRSMIGAWIGLGAARRARGAGAAFRPEVPFRIGLGEETVIRGTIDLLVEPARASRRCSSTTRPTRVDGGPDPVLPRGLRDAAPALRGGDRRGDRRRAGRQRLLLPAGARRARSVGDLDGRGDRRRTACGSRSGSRGSATATSPRPRSRTRALPRLPGAGAALPLPARADDGEQAR